MEAFPYAPRPGQEALVRLLATAASEGGHAVAESGTGTGKTVCALAAALPAALAEGRRVLYLTRTNAQERQVMAEFRRIAPRLPAPAAPGSRPVAVALQGRAHLCPLAAGGGDGDPEMAKADAEELSVMCRDRVRAADEEIAGKRRSMPAVEPCARYAATRGPALDEILPRLRAEAPEAEELAALVAGRGMCPYYVTRGLVAEASLVAAPYVWFFNPHLRRALLERMGASLGGLVVVVDEAHNVPDYARSLNSASLGRAGLARAAREAEEFGDRELPGGTTLSSFLLRLGGIVEALAAEHLDGEDGLVPEDDFDAEVLSALRSTTRTWDRVAAALLGYGEEVRQARRKAGRVPRSHVGSVGAFLAAYREADPATHLRLVEDAARSRTAKPCDEVATGPADPRLALACLDASIACAPLLDCHATLHVSGTLAPIEAYRDEVGLPRDRTRLAAFPSPFARKRRLLLVDPTVTTAYAETSRDAEMWPRLVRRVAACREAAAGRNVAVFAPSFDALARIAPALHGADVVEARGMRQGDLVAALQRFKSSRGATLAAVAAGRVAEGLDFPGGELECVVVAGLPYPKPTARLQGLVRLLDARFGRGFEYAVVVPTVRRTMQAIGRLIRSPEDRGVAVVLDRRAAALLAPHAPDLVVAHDAPERARAFFH